MQLNALNGRKKVQLLSIVQIVWLARLLPVNPETLFCSSRTIYIFNVFAGFLCDFHAFLVLQIFIFIFLKQKSEHKALNME